nr:hypothetical protein CFP56_11611 [Quercus suber]
MGEEEECVLRRIAHSASAGRGAGRCFGEWRIAGVLEEDGRPPISPGASLSLRPTLKRGLPVRPSDAFPPRARINIGQLERRWDDGWPGRDARLVLSTPPSLHRPPECASSRASRLGGGLQPDWSRGWAASRIKNTGPKPPMAAEDHPSQLGTGHQVGQHFPASVFRAAGRSEHLNDDAEFAPIDGKCTDRLAPGDLSQDAAI